MHLLHYQFLQNKSCLWQCTAASAFISCCNYVGKIADGLPKWWKSATCTKTPDHGQDQCITWNACLPPSYHRYQITLLVYGLQHMTHCKAQSQASSIYLSICHNHVMCQNGETHRMLSGRHCWQKCDISDVFWQWVGLTVTHTQVQCPTTVSVLHHHNCHNNTQQHS